MRHTVRHERIDYLVADDDALPYDQRWWAVLRTRAVDELTGAPPLNPLSIATTTPGCLPRVAGDGLCGLVARPGTVSRQILGPGRLTAEIRADGYLPRSLTAAIDAARRTTPGAAAGAPQLTISPPEPTPPAPRPQFLPGRGVLLEAPVGQRDFMTLHADPATAPAPNVVPLADPVDVARPAAGPWQVAGVPIVLPDQPLHRAQPAVVRGRALRQMLPNAAPSAAPSARIGLTGLWWTCAEIPANSTPPHPADLVSFAAPLAFDHPAASVQRLTLRTPDGVARTLVAGAPAGALEIELTDVSGLATGGGDTLELEAANSAERELVRTAGYAAPVTGTRAVVRLATPLAFPHAAGAPATGVALTFAVLGSLAREAQRGDRVLFATTLAGVAARDVLRVAGGTPLEELRFVQRFPLYDSGTNTFDFEVTLDSDGTFALPPIARVAQIQLFVEHAGQAVHAPVDFVPDYRSDSPLQILFTP